MSSMFGGCKALTSLDLSSFNTSLVEDMGGVFNCCGKLISLDLSTFDTSNATSKAGMFSNTSLLAICLSEKFEGFPTLPNNTGAIADTGLSTTGKWIDPDGGVCGLRVTANADFAKFRGAAVDGALVNPENYTAESGSTVVTLRPAYLATLAPGQHTLRLIFDDGAAETTFTVAAAPEPEPEPDDPKPLPDPGDNPDPGSGGASGQGGSVLAPTGDVVAPFALAAAVLAGLAAAALSAARRARR